MSRQVSVRLFGAFRQGNPQPELAVEVPSNATVADLRQAMHEALDSDNARSLLKASAFATDTEVLDDGDVLPEREISVLPPVCGG